jgi:hypothetical protein
MDAEGTAVEIFGDQGGDLGDSEKEDNAEKDGPVGTKGWGMVRDSQGGLEQRDIECRPEGGGSLSGNGRGRAPVVAGNKGRALESSCGQRESRQKRAGT